MIRTTVVIPVYNGIDFLDDCLKSVFASNTDVKVIVVDNGSEDGSCEFVEKNYPLVKLIRFDENKGFSKAVNAGIAAADTEFVFLLNDDATINEDVISILEKDMDDDPKLFSVQAKMLQKNAPSLVDSVGDNYCLLGWAYAVGKDKDESKFQGIRSVFSACAGASLYRREVFGKIGCFDVRHFAYLEDVDIGYRALVNGYLNKADMRAIAYHVGSGTSGSRYNEFKVSLSARNSVYIIYKNMPLLQVLINLPFFFVGFATKTVFFIKKGFGKAYVEGLLKGVGMCFGRRARKRKTKFKAERLSTYIAIQVLLFVNVLRRFL